MPVRRCRTGSKPGFKWGKRGKCYPYTPGKAKSRKRARRKALKQGRAIQARRRKR